MFEKIIEEIKNGIFPNENTFLEYKSFNKAKNFTSIKGKILENIIAFANEKGGIIVFGVEDEKKWVSISNDLIKDLNDNKNITDLIRTYLNYEVKFETKWIKIENELRFFLEIKKSDKIISNKKDDISFQRTNGQNKKILNFSKIYDFFSEKYEMIEKNKMNEWNKNIIDLFESVFITNDYWWKEDYKINFPNMNNEVLLKIIKNIKNHDIKKVKEIVSDFIPYFEELKNIDPHLIPDLKTKFLNNKNSNFLTLLSILNKKYKNLIENESIIKYENIQFDDFFNLNYKIEEINSFNERFKNNWRLKKLKNELEEINIINSPYDENFSNKTIENNLNKINDFLKNLENEILKNEWNKFSYHENLHNIIYEMYIDWLNTSMEKHNINSRIFLDNLKDINKIISQKKINNQEFILFQKIFFIYKIFREIFSINFDKFENLFITSYGIENFLDENWIYFISKMKILREKILKKLNYFFEVNDIKNLSKNNNDEIAIVYENLIWIQDQINIKYFNFLDIENDENDLKKFIINLLKSFRYTPDEYMNSTLNKNKFWYTPNLIFPISEIEKKIETMDILNENFWTYIENLFNEKKEKMLEKILENNGRFSSFEIYERNLSGFKNKYKKIKKWRKANKNDFLVKKYIVEYCDKYYRKDWDISLKKYYLENYNEILIKFLNDYDKILFIAENYKKRTFKIYKSKD